MFDHCFVDIDNTIFDCRELEKDMFALLQESGVTHSDFAGTYGESLHTVGPDQFDYFFEEQLDILRARGYVFPEDILTKLNSLLQKNYLFTDAVDFLAAMKKNCARIVVLTAGDHDFQIKKIIGNGIEKLCHEYVVLNGHKEEWLADQKFDIRKSFFINDNLKENLLVKSKFPDLNVLTKWKQYRHPEAEMVASGLPYFDSLTAIKNYVTGLTQ